jgi:phosphoglycerate dehydrogenase-like enzyme
VQLEPRPLQPRASPVGIARVVVVNSALRRLYPVSRALQVGNGVLARLRPHAFPARSLRHPPGEDGCLGLLRGCRWPSSDFPSRLRQSNIFGCASQAAVILGCMELSRPPLVVAFELSEKRKAIIAEALAGASAVVYLTELDEPARAEALRNTGVLLTFNTAKELRPGEAALLDGARLIQFMIAGVDFIPLSELPEGVPVATNGGCYDESMAEHALAMALAAAKRLILEHENLKRGQFNQFTRNRMLAGGLCGIFGFGGVGVAAGRLMHGIGMRVHAVNRHGRTNERVDWIGTPERLNELLEVADVLLISAPLTRATYGLIGAAELRRMKSDAILVNLARGEIVQERPLFEHLVQHPRFTACIDAWWIEPVRHGEFRIDQPFLGLPNVIASPHNSAQGAGAHDISLRRAVENCRRALTGETPLHLIGPDERLM